MVIKGRTVVAVGPDVREMVLPPTITAVAKGASEMCVPDTMIPDAPGISVWLPTTYSEALLKKIDFPPNPRPCAIGAVARGIVLPPITTFVVADTHGFCNVGDGDGFAIVLFTNEVNDVRVMVSAETDRNIIGPPPMGLTTGVQLFLTFVIYDLNPYRAERCTTKTSTNGTAKTFV